MDGKAVRRLVIFGLYILHSYCYQVTIIVRETKTWEEARSYCRENHNDLITINSVEESTMLGDILRNSDKQFWIGLYGNFYNFDWSMVQEGSDEGQVEYSNWEPSQPNLDRETINCVNIGKTRLWSDATCSTELPFVCYHGLSENRYRYVTEKMNWTNAQMHCRKHHTDLVSIRTESENEEIVRLVQSNSWIGYYRLSWMWSDGQARHIHSFNNWGAAQPARVRGYCATTNNIKWTERPCSDKYYFICNSTMKKQMRIKMVWTTSDSSTNMKDIQDAILQQFSETLKKNQISEQISLKWVEQPDGKIYQKTEEQERKEKQDFDCVASS